MKKTVIQGRLSHKLRSLAVSSVVASQVFLERVFGKPRVDAWPFLFEYGTRYMRAQFNHAFRLSNDMNASRAYFDSVYGLVNTYPDVEIRPSQDLEPNGHWFIPKVKHSEATLLHYHGGGYAFYAEVSYYFIACLAHTLGVTIFAPNYRLTPEHPHPAQQEDGLAAYRYLLDLGIDHQKIILCGDSAGGHLALMTLVNLHRLGLPKPALTIGLSPWTDIGKRGKSLFGNDPYDLVQGYMALQFAAWLKGNQSVTDIELSPIYQDYSDLGPIYLQAGGKEILIDMIRDFAIEVMHQGGKIRLDVWAQMNHEFHAYGDYLPESQEALAKLRDAVNWALDEPHQFKKDLCSEFDCLLY